jgi:hypothetical protein
MTCYRDSFSKTNCSLHYPASSEEYRAEYASLAPLCHPYLDDVCGTLVLCPIAKKVKSATDYWTLGYAIGVHILGQPVIGSAGRASFHVVVYVNE